MEKNIVISQPLYIPWLGMFEQIKLADIYVYYDDAQYPLGRGGHFINRVQIKMCEGQKWMTVPIIRKNKNKQKIFEVKIDDSKNWRQKQIKTLKFTYSKSQFYDEMIELALEIIRFDTKSLSELNIHAIERICDYFGLTPNFFLSSDLGFSSSSSKKVFDIVKHFNGTKYITGWGAQNYLDHKLFENNGIKVEYMNYKCKQYPQLYGEFIPYVSILDLIANCGKDGINYFNPDTLNWREFIDGSN